MTDLHWVAYLMATVKHECANKWIPIEEYSSGVQYETRADLGNVNKGDGSLYKEEAMCRSQDVVTIAILEKGSA